MNRVSFLALFLLVLSACGAPATDEGSEEEILVTYFENGRAVGPDGSVIENVAMIVEGGIIRDIGPADDVPHPPGADRFDLSDHTIFPFMHNMHGHIGLTIGSNFDSANYSRETVVDDLDRYLYWGVASVAVLGTDIGDLAFEIRAGQRSGELGGARLYTAGQGITSRGGWPSTLDGLDEVPTQVNSEDEARQAVRDLAAKEVDFVKIWLDDARQVTGQIYRGGRLADQVSTIPKLRPEYYAAVIDEAHQNNIRVVAHVLYLADAKRLVDAGVDGLVHSIRDRNVDDALIQAMLENDVFYVPTLTAHEAAFVYADEPEWLGERTIRETVSGSTVGRISSPGFVGRAKQDLNLNTKRRQFDTAMGNLKTLADAGVTIGFGTDSGALDRFAGYFEHRELELMVNAGLTPEQAIVAATVTAAEILGYEESGGLVAGKRADFILVPGNPLENIADSRNIAEVYFFGRRVDRSTMMTRLSR